MKTALIAGVSGMVGGNLANLLVADKNWTVYGMARRPGQREGVTPIAVDLQDAAAVREALKDLRPTHIFLATWLRQATEAVPGLEVYGLTTSPDPTGWKLTVTFRRWERHVETPSK